MRKDLRDRGWANAAYPSRTLHDRVCARIRQLCERKGWSVEEEPHLRLPNGALRKPDLILSKANEVVICDVAIPWESPRPLAAAYQDKVSYYSEPLTRAALERRYPGRNLTFTAFVVGARGTWCSQNDRVCDVLRLNNAERKSLVRNTISGSILIHREFMRAVM